MANVTQAGKGPRFWFASSKRRETKHPVRLSALLALKEVLTREKYEECREIIAIAKEFGAEEQEIYYLLEDPRRNP
ncbi:MAG: hypothetical protein HY447_04210 [Candidatus Omnitrophica bacterium]|nr:hypothetical protein [Candidatus Omnitrophota bacterium]